MGVDDEALRYMTLTAEIRMRALLMSSVRAQQYRVTASHQPKPPLAAPRPGRSPQALWSQKITSDAHAVMQALTNANREENRAHRVARAERNARETEMARAAALQRERDGLDAGADCADPSGGDGDDGSATTSGSGGGTATRSSPREPVFQARPHSARPRPRRRATAKRPARHAHRQVNATRATAQAQLSGRKRYAWEMGTFESPHLPSLLSGKRKRAVLKVAAAGARAGPREEGEAGPHRRAVDLDVAGDKKGRDDTALTVVDMLFALEHEGGPHGPGTVDDITRRFWTRPGGPYGG